MHRLLRLDVSGGEGGTHLLFELAHSAQRDRRAQHRFEGFLDLAFAQVHGAAEKSDGRGQSWAAHGRAKFRRDLRPGLMPATAAGAGMGLILGYFDGVRRQFEHLVPAWLRVVGACRVGQVVVAVFANVGHEVMRVGDPLLRQPRPQVGVVPGLPARLATRRLLADRRRRLRRVGRGRHRGVRSVLPEACFEIADARIEFGDLLQQFSASCAGWLVHAAMLTTAGLRSCASFTQ